MRIVVPVSRSDLHLLPQWAEVHKHLKCGVNHSLHFVIPQPMEGEAHDAKASLNGFFESIEVHPMDYEPMGGWPFGPNAHFWYCAKFMSANPNVPWQLVELDCLPLYQRSYDAIASKYASCGTPFFGNVSNTPWRETSPFLMTDDGKPTTMPNPRYGQIQKSMYGDKDLMMSGCAVYPGNLLTRPRFSGLMDDFMKGQQSIDVPFDMHLRTPMQLDGMSHTELMGNYWNTENYRMEGGRIVCDSRKTHEIFQKNPNWETRKCGGLVHSDAVMIHGCKDDSLTNLILSGTIPDTIIATPQPVALAAPQTPAQPSVVDARIDKLEGMMATMLATMQQLAAPKPSPKPDGAQGEPATAVRLSPAHETKALGEPLVEKALNALPSVGSKKMLSALAKDINVDKDKLKAAIEPTGKFTIKGPAQWVERTAA